MLHFTQQIINLWQIWIFLPGRCTELQLGLCTLGESHRLCKTLLLLLSGAFAATFSGMVAAGTASCAWLCKSDFGGGSGHHRPRLGGHCPAVRCSFFPSISLLLGSNFWGISQRKAAPIQVSSTSRTFPRLMSKPPPAQIQRCTENSRLRQQPNEGPHAVN